MWMRKKGEKLNVALQKQMFHLCQLRCPFLCCLLLLVVLSINNHRVKGRSIEGGILRHYFFFTSYIQLAIRSSLQWYESFWDKVSLCSPGWPQTFNLSASASWVLELQACTTHTQLWWVLQPFWLYHLRCLFSSSTKCTGNIRNCVDTQRAQILTMHLQILWPRARHLTLLTLVYPIC
jgi:hypothetical protein